MENKLFASLLFIMLFTGKLFAQDTLMKKGWPSEERAAFINSCINNAKASLSEDSARSYCYCMQEKIEKKYPTMADAEKITAEDLASAAWKKEIQDCLKPASTWGTVDRAALISNCIANAKAGLGEEKAKSYCECMLFKIEGKYPNPPDAANITGETLKSPDWQKLIKSCMEF